jgi:hypothetical protein
MGAELGIWIRPEAVGMAESAPTRSEPRIDLIDGPHHPSEPSPAHLVGHGVSQGLDRGRAGNAVAVEVQKGVQLGQGKGTVTIEDRYARRSKLTPPQEAVLGGQGSQGWQPMDGRTSAVVVLDSGPELVSQFFEQVEELHPAGVSVGQCVVQRGQLGHQRLPLEVAGATGR